MSRYNSTLSSRAHFLVEPALPEIGLDAANNLVTLFARFKWLDVTGIDARFIASGNSSQAPDHRFMLGLSGSQVRARVKRDSTTATCFAGSPTEKVWHTASVISDATIDVATLNDATGSATGSTGDLVGMSANQWLHLGNMPGYAQSSMKGYLMDCAIWNAALTYDEIYTLNSGVRPGDIRFSSLVGWWPMESDDPPAIVRDYSRWQRHGIHSQAVYNGDTTGTAGVSVWERSNDQPIKLQPLRSRRRIFLPPVVGGTPPFARGYGPDRNGVFTGLRM